MEVSSINSLIHYSKAIGDVSCAEIDHIPVTNIRYIARLEAQKNQRKREMDNLTEILN